MLEIGIVEIEISEKITEVKNYLKRLKRTESRNIPVINFSKEYWTRKLNHLEDEEKRRDAD